MIKPVYVRQPDLESLAGKYTFQDPYRLTPAEKIFPAVHTTVPER
jgi:hypothetical protein